MTDREAIKDFRKKRGWTQGRLADELGITLSTVWRLEAGRLKVSNRTKKALDMLAIEHPEPSAEPAE